MTVVAPLCKTWKFPSTVVHQTCIACDSWFHLACLVPYHVLRMIASCISTMLFKPTPAWYSMLEGKGAGCNSNWAKQVIPMVVRKITWKNSNPPNITMLQDHIWIWRDLGLGVLSVQVLKEGRNRMMAWLRATVGEFVVILQKKLCCIYLDPYMFIFSCWLCCFTECWILIRQPIISLNQVYQNRYSWNTWASWSNVVETTALTFERWWIFGDTCALANQNKHVRKESWAHQWTTRSNSILREKESLLVRTLLISLVLLMKLSFILD